MIETFLLLLTGHLLADFVFQPDALVRMKRKALGMLAHIAIVAVAAIAALAPGTPWRWTTSRSASWEIRSGRSP